MMMMQLLAIGAIVLASPTVSAIQLSTHSDPGRNLLSQSRALNDNGNADYSFLAEYSIKFQGCHHVQQWNDEADEEDEVRIMTKRLVRFRLCEAESCSSDRSAGCSTKYGDYVVDMDTFVESYLNMAEQDGACDDAADACGEECANDDDCMATCYAQYDAEYCLEQPEGFDVGEYASCAEFNLGGGRRLEENNNNDVQYYIGAFCADQGGEIHLGLFTDDTCTTFASNGYSIFANAMGYAMPYSETSLVTGRCLACGVENENGYMESKEVCEDSYALAGKCETRMNVDYPNESSCNYIEGIKIIREDGVIRTSAVKKSKAAAVAIGLFTTLSVLLAAYVYYLRTKLGRAQINLAASSQPLT